MGSIRILLLRPASDDPAVVDQSLGARLAANTGPASADVIVEEETFRRDDLTELERQLARWRGKVSGVIGATNVPESTRLGELAEQMNLVCFVANNNPSVRQRRRNVFHIGLPSTQTSHAVAALLRKAQRKRIFMLHDQTEFQQRVASSMETAFKAYDMEVISQAALSDSEWESLRSWQPDLIYVIFSNESKALALTEKIRKPMSETPLLFGRSLLRETFLKSLSSRLGEAWFVDMFQRDGTHTHHQQQLINVLSSSGATVPTANHAFGWDALSFCALGLKAAAGEPQRAVDYLESGVLLEGVTGTCSFSPDNHNGRSGFGPTTLTRWYKGRLEEV